MKQVIFPISDPYREELNPASLQTLQNGNFTVRSQTSSFSLEWLDSKEAANLLKVSVGMLRNMASNGQVPFYKLGRRNRYRKDELETLLLKNKRGPS